MRGGGTCGVLCRVTHYDAEMVSIFCVLELTDRWCARTTRDGVPLRELYGGTPARIAGLLVALVFHRPTRWGPLCTGPRLFSPAANTGFVRAVTRSVDYVFTTRLRHSYNLKRAFLVDTLEVPRLECSVPPLGARGSFFASALRAAAVEINITGFKQHQKACMG